MRFHWQNLNERNTGENGFPWHGRAWWNTTKAALRIEWVVGWALRLGIEVCDDEYPIDLRLGLGFLTVYIAVTSRGMERWLREFFKIPGYEAREIKVYVHENALWWMFWTDPMCWSSKTPRWRHGCFTPVDFIFGGTKYSEAPIKEVRVEIPMPEKTYPATVKLYEARWHRPRWPFVWSRWAKADITPDTPIPVPGKGENSWDCGEDATHSLSCAASSTHEAVGKMVETVMRSRMKYGGQKWRPQGETASA